MSDNGQLDLYELLPALYRIRDAERGYPLKALLRLIDTEATHVRENIDALWDDFFIETCAEWVIPYIGDLVGNTPLHEGIVRRRADVAKTIYYRRRKGTLPMLEELARDVTGWGAHAVAFFEQLGWNQNLNHLRYAWSPSLLRPAQDSVDRVGTVNLRNLDALDRLDGPFELTTHTVDVRRIRQAEGWYNIRNIGFFLWRLESYHLTEIRVPLASVPFGYHFSTLGCPMPLFTHPERETDDTGLAQEIHVPGPIRPLALHFDLEDARRAVADGLAATSDYVGEDRSLRIKLVSAGGEEIIPPEEIIVMDLEVWKQPDALLTDNTGTLWPVRVGVDPRRGRLVFADGREPAVDEEVVAAYNYGFSADLGGGPYDRRKTMAQRETDTWYAEVSQVQPDVLPLDWDWFPTVLDALTAWSTAEAGGPPDNALIEINDNGIYEETWAIDLANAQTLTIQAADDQRPTIRLVDPGGLGPGLLTVDSTAHTEATLTLNGLLVEGGVVVRNTATRNSLGELRLVHCTLVPGHQLDEACDPVFPDHPSLEVEEPTLAEIEVEIDHSISGWLLLASENVELTVRDSILDAMPRHQPAFLTPALLSGSLTSPFVPLTSPTPQVLVTLGNEGPHLATFPPAGGPYSSPGAARAGLQAAIRAAHASDAFQQSRVLTDQNSNRLIVVPGRPVEVTIDPAPGAGADDPTADELRLVRAPNRARPVVAFVGDPLPPNFTLTAGTPTLQAIAGTGPPVEIVLNNPSTPTQARNQLRNALHNVNLGSTELNAPYATARVELINFDTGRGLLVVPGTDDAIVFRTAPSDATTLSELGLQSQRPALAGSFGGEHAGPPATLERVTIFGRTHVRICTLASEVIFTGTIVAQRRQQGCVRFSYVAPGSRTPRRYRCQPDLALEARALKKGLASTDDLSETDRRLVENQMRPDFTSEHYGDPGYAQLSLTTACEIRTGAEDGSEMGVFSLLKQPQREANLRIRLEEYLPFGLEAGFIFVT